MMNEKKIVVIADDFTGAAEIAGIGIRHGLKVVIETDSTNNHEVDLLVIATDTRSLPASEAVRVIKKVTQNVIQSNPFLIYKKIDSVLRGNVSEELEAQLEAMKLEKAIIIAGNPGFKRVIKDGKYYINEVPLHESSFVLNYQHPINTNEVLDILYPTDKYPLYCKKNNETLPDKGLIMGDIENIEDFHKWTQLFSNDILFAGASGFFNSLLESLNLSGSVEKTETNNNCKKRVFVLGSYYPKSNNLIEKIIQNGYYHSNMPIEIYNKNNYSADIFENWFSKTLNGLKNQNKVVITSLHSNSKDPNIYNRVKKEISELINKLCNEADIDEILIEGGSTTWEILNKLNVKSLIPFEEIETGVIRMHVNVCGGVYITTKPGSYEWPENIWEAQHITNYNKLAY